MSDVLHGIGEDVRFDFGAADALISHCNSVASLIDGQAAARSSWTNTALTDFEGHFANLFRANQRTAAADRSELTQRLRDVAKSAQSLKDSAEAENKRRRIAREWMAERKDQNGFTQWLSDTFTDSEEPPVGPPDPPLHEAHEAPKNTPRETPPPGSGGGGGSTTSARPENLRTFARQSRAANHELQSKAGELSNKLSAFTDGCGWGSLDASGVVRGFQRWLSANDQDVEWASTVASAFEAAGGHGRLTLPNSAISAALQAAGVNAVRHDLTIEMPVAYGHPPTTGYAVDPVNTSTGNFIESETDLAFPGAAGLLALSRCYNSFDTEHDGAFGVGWSSLAEAGLRFEDDSAWMRLADGRHIQFPRLGAGWGRAVGESLWLVATDTFVDGSQPTTHGLRASDNDGSWWEFTADGHLYAYGNGPHDWLRLVRAPVGDAERLVRIEHARGRSITLEWGPAADGSGRSRVRAAFASDGRQVRYEYDQEARLIAASGPLGTREYRWDDQGLIAAVLDADGVVEAENTYDEHRRVVRQRTQHGRVVRFAYLPGRVTVVSDEDGSRSNTWIADRRGRLIAVVDSDENRQSMAYDQYGNQLVATERDGSTTVHEYDGRGRRVRTVTPSGADITYGYDDLDRVTTVVAEQGAITELTYDGEERHPTTVTDPEGGVTRLEWTDGLLTAVIDPTGVTVRFGYDEHGDLVTVTDAEGNTARTERDAWGRVSAAITPSGNRTTFEYDPVTGLLAARVDPDGARWSFEHTAAGRLAATVDPTGARTTIEHGRDGESTRTIDPLGRSITRRFDDLGNLASAELPDGSTWRFTHDPLSRLPETIDPTGAAWKRDFDSTGAVIGATDPTGVQRTMSADPNQGVVTIGDSLASQTSTLDPLGRITSLGQADGSAAMFTYDRCGRVVEALDAEGALTRVRRDAAGRPIEITDPLGAVTTYEYDRCGRLAAVIDPTGGRVTISYDADGRPVRQTLPTGESAWTRYDSCGRVISHHRPGQGAARYVYDAAGRVIEARDSRTGLRRFRYDAAGQLTAVTNGNGGVTRYAYDANGRATEITDPNGGVTRREFDAMNRCVAETDPLGRTTRAGYDDAGRLVWQEDPTGRRTTWTFDSNGRLSELKVDGRLVSRSTHDVRARTVRVDDHLDSDAADPVVHELEWNRRGQLVRRRRGDRDIRWFYDGAGRRTSMTTPDGLSTSYEYDAASRLVAVSHPLLGRAVLERDASGRLVAAAAGDLIQSWEYRGGWVSAHTVTSPEGSTRTAIERDEDGRIGAVVRHEHGIERRTEYRYDEACQLIEARLGDEAVAWRYDAGGRLVSESRDGETTTYAYDEAAQLTSISGPAGRTRYHYDGAGRRVRASSDDGRMCDYRWGPTGYLSGVTVRDGDRARTIELNVDATGELANAAGEDLWWDTAAYAGAPVIVGDRPVVRAGAVTGVGQSWQSPGWRTARAQGTGDGIWSSLAAEARADGVRVGPAGEVAVAGLEWMGARAYDSESRGFLSVDPLDPVTGAGWSGNPYSYAGNDPLQALDPLGLRPATDADLDAYANAHGINGTLGAVTDWAKSNWEYVAGGAMVIAGGALMLAPVPGVAQAAGAALISAGADTLIQKATTGNVNWGQVAVSGAAGAIGFGVGGAVAKAGMTAGRATLTAGVSEGALASGGTYLTGPGPHTPQGLITTMTVGGAGGLVHVPGGLGDNIAPVATRHLDSVAPTPTSTPLYRGVAEDHHVYAEALKGEAWPGDILGHEDALLHTAGSTGGSRMTSWTTDPKVAQRFATNDGTVPGVILKTTLEEHAHKVVPNEIRVGDESEVLIRGIVSGAEVTKVSP